LFRYLLGRDDTPRLVDLLLHLPASVIDRRARPKIRDAVPGNRGDAGSHRRPAPPDTGGGIPVRRTWSMPATDTGDVVLTYCP